MEGKNISLSLFFSFLLKLNTAGGRKKKKKDRLSLEFSTAPPSPSV